MSWTLEYNGVVKTFPQWGFTDPMFYPMSLDASRFTVRAPGVDVTIAPPIPYDGAVIIRRGSEIIFQGTQSQCKLMALPNARQDALTFADPWWQLQQTIFQQTWNFRQSADDTNTTKYFSRLNLFQEFPSGFPLSTGAQIVEILNWAISCGVNLQIGQIDPQKFLNPIPVRARSCAECIILCLKMEPDAGTWIDLSTMPPTFHCRTRANKTAVTVPFSSEVNGVKHKSSEVTPRPDLAPAAVVIQYQQEGASAYSDIYVDAYPPGSTGREIRALVLPFDVRGVSMGVSKGWVRAAAFSTANLNWWKQKKPELADSRVTGLSQLTGSGHPVTVTDDAGNAVNLALYPNEFIDGAVASWMPVRVIEATVAADFAYVETEPSGVIKVRDFSSHRVTARVKLTNSPVGLAPYSTITSSDNGDFIPTGLAESLYNSLSELQYEGDHTIIEPGGPTQIIGPWHTLNLTGGHPDWETAQMTIQSARIDFFRGITNLTFGPAKHIAPDDLIEYASHARGRVIFEDLSARTSGQSNGGSGSESGKNSPRENTTAGLTLHKYFGSTFKQS